jgi:hypothetical protein
MRFSLGLHDRIRREQILVIANLVVDIVVADIVFVKVAHGRSAFSIRVASW